MHFNILGYGGCHGICNYDDHASKPGTYYTYLPTLQDPKYSGIFYFRLRP